MDITTIMGVLGAVGLIVSGVAGNQISASLINMHGVVVVHVIHNYCPQG